MAGETTGTGKGKRYGFPNDGKYWEGKKDVPYFSEDCNNQNDAYRETNAWGETSRNEWEMPRGKGKQNDPYRNTNDWGETSRNEWEMLKGKGKGQGMKGDQMLKTDPAGEIYEKSTWAIKHPKGQ